MFDERPTSPSPEQLEELGLSAEDLQGMDEGVGVGGEDDVEDNEPELDTTGAPADPAAPEGSEPAAPTPPPSGARTEEPGQPAAAAPPRPAAAPTTTAPKTPDQPVTPWTPTIERRPVVFDGATIDTEGNIRIPATAVPKLMGHLADRNVWQQERAAWQQERAALDPAHNEKVLLSQLIADEMDAASDPAKGGSPEKLWEWVQDFQDSVPRLKETARTKAVEAENQRLRGRLDPIDQEAERQQIEPELQRDLGAYLDQYLERPQYAGLKGERVKLAQRLWSMKDQLIGRAGRDYPEHGLKAGQFYVMFDVLERELGFAAELVAGRQAAASGEAERKAAEARNRAALGNPDIPPTTAAGGVILPDGGDKSGRPKTREEWQERMDKLASTP